MGQEGSCSEARIASTLSVLLPEPFWTENRDKKLARTAQCPHKSFLSTATIRQEPHKRFEELCDKRGRISNT